MKRLLITGASSLIGKAVIENLVASGEEVEIYVASSPPDKLKIKADNIFVISNEQIEKLFSSKDVDILLHLAFPRNVSEIQWAPGIKYAIDILFLAHKYSVKRIINVSSQSIYGLQRKKPADELHEIVLSSAYTTGKYCTEVVCENLFQRGIYTNIRLSTTIGPTTKERVPNKLFDQIVRGSDLTINGGHQQFSFLDVRDAAAALVCLMRYDNIPWEIAYNIGTNEAHSLLDIANMCVHIAKEYGYNSTQIKLIQEDIVIVNQTDVKRFEQEFSWKARYNLKESLNYIFEQNYL